jgi:ketosteroid isomerase-like protein
MEIDNSFAKDHIESWTKAWNDHNLKDILSHYSEKILFHSPKVELVVPNRIYDENKQERLRRIFFSWLEEISGSTLCTSRVFLERSYSDIRISGNTRQ